MTESIKCGECPALRQVDATVRQYGIECVDDAVICVALGDIDRSSTLLAVGKGFIDLADGLDKQLTGTCNEPQNGRCTASQVAQETVGVICSDIDFAKQNDHSVSDSTVDPYDGMRHGRCIDAGEGCGSDCPVG